MPVGKLLGRPTPKPPKWQTIVRWRDWSLPVKLGAVTLVPIVVALVLGGVTFANRLDQSDRYERVDRLAKLSEATTTLLDGVQRERTATAAALTTGSGSDSPELRTLRADVDKSVAPTRQLIERAGEGGDGLAEAGARVDGQLDKLAQLRGQVRDGRVEPLESVSRYTDLTTALLDLDTAIAAGIGDDAIGSTPSALRTVLVAKEEVSTEQALIGYGIGRGGLAPSEFNQLRTSYVRLTDRIAEFDDAATTEQQRGFDAAVRGNAFDTRDQQVRDVLAGQDSRPGQVFQSLNGSEWTDVSNTVFAGLSQTSARLAGELASTASDLADGAGSSVGFFAVLLVFSLALAVFVVFVITRELLRSLRTLRSSAMEVAERELPDTVRAIQEGRSASTDVQPVAVRTNDEVGEVARAFDAVHREAVRLAAEQAGMRTGYASVFVNLSRRSQSLVQRQLQLIERLERDEEDADQLATLFQLDHLATRMRRNNENLMVLSGSEPGRRSGQPVTVTDVLRAGVSEIEQYQRVVVQPPPSSRIVGYAAGDLVRLIAELLDNATAFSAPETEVTLASRTQESGSLAIDIVDKGIGMNEAEVAEANARLTEAGSVDLATSRRMGLFVVGRLAIRHGFAVGLHGGRNIVGVRATVTVPAELVMAEGQAPQPPQLGQLPRGPETPQPSLPQRSQNQQAAGPNGLPRRKTNGANRSGALASFTAAGMQAPPPSANEVSGTALFTPIGGDDAQSAPPQSPAKEDPETQPAVTPPPREPATESAPRDETAPSPREPLADEGSPSSGDTVTDGVTGEPSKEQQAETASRSDEVPADLSGAELFEATGTEVSDWWSAATTESQAEQRARLTAQSTTETTPIFDEALSAWFRSVTEPVTESEKKKTKDWDFAADERWRTVEAVAKQAKPADYTQAGLPRRRRGERLLPGSATPEQQAGTDTPATDRSRPVRDPLDVRGRLSSFQQGVNRGRKRHSAEQNGAAPAASQGRQTGAAGPRPQQDASPATNASGLPQRQPKRKQAPAPTPEPTVEAADATTAAAATETGTTGADAAAGLGAPESTPSSEAASAAPAAEWAFAADDRWRTVQAVSDSAPSSYTASGLPRRRRGAQLLPGSAATVSAEPGPRPDRDADDVRGRLSSFQQGIRRGRHRTAQATESSQEKMEGE